MIKRKENGKTGKQEKNKRIQEIYNSLFDRFGAQDWWPADTPFEVIIGAILTQNTSWSNVEKAIVNLKKAKVLTPTALSKITQKNLARLIRPAGYYNIKAKRLKNFLLFLQREYSGGLKKLSRLKTGSLRRKLLEVNGIGPETADSILLYAFNRPVFVIDAYTKRILTRHDLAQDSATYYDLQALFYGSLKKNTRIFNEYHALIVKLAKDHCRPTPRCAGCPLR